MKDPDYTVAGFKIISTGDDAKSVWTHAHRGRGAFSGLTRYDDGTKSTHSAYLVAGQGYWYALFFWRHWLLTGINSLAGAAACFPGNMHSFDNNRVRCKDPTGGWNADWVELYVNSNL